MAPKHRDPSSPERTAVAPYNFVPAPERPWAYLDKEDSPRRVDHSAYHSNRLTGWIDVMLETKSPVYVRGPLTPEEYVRYEAQEADDNVPHLQKLRNKPEFFYTRDPNTPVIPGSSIRGHLRTLVQIIGYGKLLPVSDTKLVFRALVDENYRSLLIDEVQKNHFVPRVQGGYMYRDDDDNWFIRPAQEINGTTYARISHKMIPGFNPKSPTAKLRKLRKWQNCKNAFEIFVQVGSYEYQPVRNLHIMYAKVIEVGEDESNGRFQQAVMAVSGPMNKKASEAVIFAPDEQAKLIPVPDSLVTAYREQISTEQVQLLGEQGVLRQHQPVFYRMNGNILLFFGHTLMFRMPYENSPRDLLSPPHRDERLVDYAEAIFGSAKGQENSGQAGRVFVTDAVMKPGQVDPWLKGDQVVIPKILSGPKATTYQHYLTQANPDEARGRGLHNYNGSYQKTTLRGFKMYWHKGNANRALFAEPKGAVDEEKDTQHTKIKPVRSGLEFGFRIYFENLLLDELGLLWWTLALPIEGEYCHKLGMGKPLGLGAVKLMPALHLVNPEVRYGSLFNAKHNNWQDAEESMAVVDHLQARAVADFEASILKFLQQEGTLFEKLPQVQALLTLLSWPGPQPPEDLTRYMEIERDDPQAKKGKRNEYRERPVLPTPQGVMKQSRQTVWPKTQGTMKQSQQTAVAPKNAEPASTTLSVSPGYQTGRVKKFGLGNGTYGFIQPEGGGKDVFVHRDKLTPGLSTLREGQWVVFRVKQTPRGLQAEDVRLA